MQEFAFKLGQKMAESGGDGVTLEPCEVAELLTLMSEKIEKVGMLEEEVKTLEEVNDNLVSEIFSLEEKVKEVAEVNDDLSGEIISLQEEIVNLEMED